MCAVDPDKSRKINSRFFGRSSVRHALRGEAKSFSAKLKRQQHSEKVPKLQEKLMIPENAGTFGSNTKKIATDASCAL
jgi:hypothetical protein